MCVCVCVELNIELGVVIYGLLNFYILGLHKAASQQEIKKAYYKLALRLHPDNEEAKEKFQLCKRLSLFLVTRRNMLFMTRLVVLNV